MVGVHVVRRLVRPGVDVREILPVRLERLGHQPGARRDAGAEAAVARQGRAAARGTAQAAEGGRDDTRGALSEEPRAPRHVIGPVRRVSRGAGGRNALREQRPSTLWGPVEPPLAPQGDARVLAEVLPIRVRGRAHVAALGVLAGEGPRVALRPPHPARGW